MIHWKSGTAALVVAAAVMSTSAFAETIKLELWSRADPSGPLRPGNVVKAADRLNEALKKEGSADQVEVSIRETPAKGFDEDALQLLKVFGIGEGPDMFIAAHEWICAFQQDGFALKLDDYIAKYPDKFGTIYPALWNSVECADGGRYGIPQDAEARMFFYSKSLMRKAGYDDAFIEGLPDQVLKGEITMDDLIDIAAKVQEKTGAKYGILHRPSKGPDYLMVFQTYGNTFVDPKTGQLMLERDKLVNAFGWFEKGVKAGVIAANNTSMEWDDIRAQFYKENNDVFWMYGIWDLGSVAFPTFGLPQDEATFSKDWGWVACPPAEKGGKPSSLTHPVIYAVAANTKHPDLAVRLLGFASDPDLNVDHAVSTTHLGIKPEELNDPRYAEAWPLAKASSMLEFTKFLPNNPQFGDLNGIIYKAMQGVELGRLNAEDAADFVIDEAGSTLKDVEVN